MDLNVPLRVIGIVRSSRTELETTPVQAAINRSEHGTIEIADQYADGLDRLADFDYAWMLTWLHRSDEPSAASRFDRPPGEPHCGWFDDVAVDQGVTPARLA